MASHRYHPLLLPTVAAFISGILTTLTLKAIYKSATRIPFTDAISAAGIRNSDRELSDDQEGKKNGGIVLEDHTARHITCRHHEDDGQSRMTKSGGECWKEGIKEGIEACIGDTPLVLIKSLSKETGCEILGKAEVRGSSVAVYSTAAWDNGEEI